MKKCIFSPCRLTLCLAACVILSGCISTPEETFVAGKDESIAFSTQGIEAENAETNETPHNTTQTVRITDEYFGAEDNVTIKIDAEVDVTERQMSVLKIVPHVFTADDVKTAADVFFEGHTAYEYSITKTKSELEELILGLKQPLSDEEQLLKDVGGHEGNMLSLKDDLQYELSRYEAEYETAPIDENIPETEYIWKSYDEYNEYADPRYEDEIYTHTDRIKLKTDIDGALVTVDVRNRSEADYQIHSLIQHFTKNKLTLYQQEMFTESREEIAEKVEDQINALGMGEWKCDHMHWLHSNRGYYYYITLARYYNGIKCIPQEQPTYYEGADDCYARSKYESIDLDYSNGRIVGMYFDAPYDVISVESESVEVMSLDEALERFKEQMQIQAMIVVDEDGKDEYGNAAPKGAEIRIDRIELGLARVRIRNSEAEYYLLPIWNFKGAIGYDYGDGPDFFVPPTQGGDTIDYTILTINAMDGTIIDVSRGY